LSGPIFLDLGSAVLLQSSNSACHTTIAIHWGGDFSMILFYVHPGRKHETIHYK
jgi:hypothetical protein